MKLLSKLALVLTIAGALAILFCFTGLGGRSRLARLESAIHSMMHPGSGLAVDQPESDSRPSADAGSIEEITEKGTPQAHVRIPAIRGLTNYGWVQLPRGTGVELVGQNAADLIVRWEGTTVKVPRAAATDGAIAIVRSAQLTARN
jgi:hypothetical protein